MLDRDRAFKIDFVNGNILRLCSDFSCIGSVFHHEAFSLKTFIVSSVSMQSKAVVTAKY